MTKEQYVKEQLAARGLKDTAANRKKLGAEYDEKYAGGKSSDWRTRFKTEFPQFSDLVDGAEGEAKARQEFGDDLIDLFLDYAKNPNKYDLTTQAGKDVWMSKVKATNLYTKVAPSRREWTLTPEANKREQVEAKKIELLQEYGELELDDKQLIDLATYALSTKASAAPTRLLLDAKQPQVAQLPSVKPMRQPFCANHSSATTTTRPDWKSKSTPFSPARLILARPTRATCC